jgi:hypothetical protein
MRYRDLAAALDARFRQRSGCEPGQVVTIDHQRRTGPGHRHPRRRHTQQITARLVVHAEGTPQNDPDVSVSDYGQHAVIAEVRRPKRARQPRLGTLHARRPAGPAAHRRRLLGGIHRPAGEGRMHPRTRRRASSPPCDAQFGTRLELRPPPARAPPSRSPCACADTSRTAPGVDRQRGTDAAPGFRPGLQPRPARRLGTRRNAARHAAWNGRAPDAGARPHSPPTRAAASRPARQHGLHRRHRPPVLQRPAAAARRCAASACSRSTSRRRCATSSPSA